MTLAAGTHLGPYEIVAFIGAGGMGEVYRARDTRLHRTVAIKIVSNQWRDQPDLRARFRREAEAIAALSHPHICALHDVGQHDDIDFLVMEHLEGETLAQRLVRGALPLPQALEYASAMADALGHAHQRGIVHRDVKPANVILTKDGLKLLDFGVARLVDAPAATRLATSTVAAVERPLTHSGATVGTWQYMSPEQIRGAPADSRSDVFSLGAVIYEMLAGRRAFTGATHHELVTAVLDRDPTRLSAANASIPTAVDHIVQVCLSKDPNGRWQSAGDVRRALDAIPLTTNPPASFRSIRPLWAAFAALVALTSVLGLLWAMRSQTSGIVSLRTIRSALPLEPGVSVWFGAGAAAFSRDGSKVVYVGVKDGRRQLYLRALDSSDETTISGTEDATSPFFSPDGLWVGFFAPGYLKKVPIGGGTAMTICNIRSSFGASWGDDDSIVFSHLPETGLFRVSSAGGAPEPLTRLADEDRGNDHRYPQILPGGHAVLYAVATGPEDSARIVVQDLRTGDRKEILRGTSAARFVAPNQIAYVRNGDLFAAPFSVEQHAITGPARRVATDVAEDTNGAPEYSVSAAGDLVYVPRRARGVQNQLVSVDLLGHVTPFDTPPAYVDRPRISPDGKLIAFYVGAAKNNVWTFDIERGATTRVTFGRFHEPVWTPAGRLTAAEGGPGAHRIVTLSADGSGASDALTETGPSQYPESWSPDGRKLIYRARQPDGQFDLWSLTPGDAQPVPLQVSPFNEVHARLSPDGRWLAYASDETGRYEIYVRSMNPDGGRWRISAGGGSSVVWSPDGRRIYYHALDGMWTVEVGQSRRFTVSRPAFMFATAGLARPFDITPDGRRFVMVRLDTTPLPDRLHLLLNPFAARAGAP